jgi:hypothetical protein
MYTNLNTITSATVRARVAYFLAIIEHIFVVVEPKDENYPEFTQTLEICWKWVEGGEILALDVYRCYGRESEDSEQIIGISSLLTCDGDPLEQGAWSALSILLLYLVWHLCRLENWEYLPANLEEFCETDIDYILESAQETEQFQESGFEPLKQYLLQTYPASEPLKLYEPGTFPYPSDEIGPPITREEVMAHLAQGS